MSLGRFKLAALVLGWQAILPCQFDTLSAQERVPEATGATEKIVDEKVVDEAKLRPALSDAVRRIPELRGSWAKVVVQPDKPLEVVLVVDADPAVGARQEELLREVVKKHAGPNFNNFGTTEVLPVGALLLKIVTASEDDPALAGVRIVDAYFYRSPGAMEDELNLKLNGSIADIGQAEVLRKACNEKWLPDIMRDVKQSSIRVDTDPPPSAADSDMGLMVRLSSTAAASVCFTTGMEAFMREDYEKSLKYLTYATQDDPKRTEIKYWRVAALIALGENERAEQIVKKMTPANRARPPYYSSRVLSSLEPLNGPKRTVIRQQLDQMVRQAVCCQ